MILSTSFKISEIKDILNEQIDPIPSILWARYRKTTQICGHVDDKGFELRNNTFHMYSLRAIAQFYENTSITNINIDFKKPSLFFNIYGQLLKRYKVDKKVILSFLKEWLEIHEKPFN